VAIQIAHLAGAGGFDDSQDAALGIFVDAIARKDARMKRVCFDVSGVAGLGNGSRHASRVAQRIRQLGLARVLYGSDASGDGESSPAARWRAWRKYPLTSDEFTAIENNRGCR
jgi:hypothetical protein